jgi:hypothetical protein
MPGGRADPFPPAPGLPAVLQGPRPQTNFCRHQRQSRRWRPLGAVRGCKGTWLAPPVPGAPLARDTQAAGGAGPAPSRATS